MLTLLLTALIAPPLTVILLTAALNAITFPRLRKTKLTPPSPPYVSVLIPARDEADVIAYTVKSLLAQQYPAFEIILLDDNSTDGTGEIARAAAGGDSRLHVIAGQPLLPGWLGKNWACHQLAGAARGEILLFTDADVNWKPGALSALIHHLTRTSADLLTAWSTQTTITWGERLIVPLIALVILGYLPAFLVHWTPFPALAAANGQCLAFRRKAYDRIGGHISARSRIVEDIVLARRIKAAGLRLRMADGAGLITCRMYRSWRGVRDGFAKNIIAGYGGRAIFLLLATAFHWLIFLVPPLWLIGGGLLPADPLYPLVPFLLTGAGLLIRAITAVATRQRVRDAIFMPISALLMTRIAAQALYWQLRYGGVHWKGRIIKPEEPTVQIE
jgi:chlorobactene glucosyltransferase